MSSRLTARQDLQRRGRLLPTLASVAIGIYLAALSSVIAAAEQASEQTPTLDTIHTWPQLIAFVRFGKINKELTKASVPYWMLGLTKTESDLFHYYQRWVIFQSPDYPAGFGRYLQVGVGDRAPQGAVVLFRTNKLNDATAYLVSPSGELRDAVFSQKQNVWEYIRPLRDAEAQFAVEKRYWLERWPREEKEQQEKQKLGRPPGVKSD